MTCQCCPDIIAALWKRQLPSNVKSAIAGMKFNKDTFNEVLQKADDVFSSNAPPTVAAIRGVAAVNLDETQPAIPYATPEVAAVARSGARGGRGRGGRGNRGGRGRGGNNGNNGGASQDSSAPKNKPARNPDLPAGDVSNFCSMHFKHGKSAFFCNAPATCPWKDVFIARK